MKIVTNSSCSAGRRMLAAALLLLLWPSSASWAQQALTQDPAEAAKLAENESISVSQTQSTWDAIEADASIETAVKDLLRPKFTQALADLKKAEEFRAAAESYRRSLETAPSEAKQQREALSQLPAAKQAAVIDTPFDTLADLQRELATQNATLEAVSEEAKRVDTELVSLREQRPAAISVRIPEAESELVQIQRQLQSADLAKGERSPGRTADRTELLAQEAKLEAEIEMLKQEKLSMAARDELLEAKSEFLAQQVANLRARVATLKQLEQQRLESEAKQAETVVDLTKQSIPQEDAAAQELVEEVDQLAKQFDEVVGQNAKITAAQADTADRLRRLEEEFERISRDLDVEDAGATMAQMAFELQDRLLDPGFYALARDPTLPTLESMRVAALRVDKQLRDQDAVEERFSRRNVEAIDQLVKTRQDLLEKLKSQYKRMIPAMITLEASNDQLRRRNQEVHDAIGEELVWIRSSPPLSLRDLVRVPEGAAWLFSVEHWREFRGALNQAFTHDPVRFVALLFLVVLLVVFRPRLLRSLESTAQGIRRVSTDRYSLTLEALLWTAMLAAPLAIVLVFLGWALDQATAPSAWLRGLADGAWRSVRIAFGIAFAWELCRPGGLGNQHFGWRQGTLDAVRRTLLRFGIVYLPAGLIVYSTLYGDASQYSDGIGRVSIMVAKLWTSFLIWHQLGGPQGLVARLHEKQPHRFLTRARVVWYPLLLLMPLAFMILAARGYVIASINFSQGFIETLGLIFLGEVVYWMVLRWFSLKARRLAVADRMERLRAAREASSAAAEEDESEESIEAINIQSEEDQHLDLATIGQQTRRVIRSLISVAVAIAMLYFWSSNFPVAPTLRAIEIPMTGGIDLFELLEAALVFAITWVLVKNIPGVLELTILSASSIDSGTRYAITALCRYALVAIGGMLIFSVLNFDWTKFGWMAAALGVGIGFGLQEVITNFVCGLILLFERPVRLGDVVTIQGVTGTVTRIRMRATTITNWDRQEFVVPNKSLITDTILNWTLSASISRIVINVGVAYGTDTEKARQILLDVAADHPNVMDEPPPMATFEQFADSALTLCLRCYVPDLDYRLRTISELHTEIDRRYAAAGIEIAFPQQDIHIRSGLEALQKPKRTTRAKPRL